PREALRNIDLTLEVPATMSTRCLSAHRKHRRKRNGRNKNLPRPFGFLVNKSEAESLLRQMLGADKSFRKGQWEAIHAAAVLKQRVLVVQRTGWGKSIVYFIATKILRDTSSGPA